MNHGRRSMKPLALSMRALTLASLVVAAGACGGRGGLAGDVDGGSGGMAGMGHTGAGGTAGMLDAAVDNGASDVARDASHDSPDVVADTGVDVAADGALEAGDGRSDGSVIGGEILCPVPTQASITDFTYVPGDGGTTTAVHFGDGQGIRSTS
jgi:hypothetical protein